MGICNYCKKEDDTRPYGPKGESICFDCAMSTPERKASTQAALGKLLDAASSVSSIIMIGGEEGPVPFSPKNLH